MKVEVQTWYIPFGGRPPYGCLDPEEEVDVNLPPLKGRVRRE